MDFDVKVFRGCEGLEQVKEDWGRIHSTMRTPSVNHDWRWYSALGQHVLTEQMWISCVYEQEEPLAIFIFLRRQRRFGFIRYWSLELLNHPAYIDTTDALIKAGHEAKPLLSAAIQAVRDWDICDLEGFGQRSQLSQLEEVDTGAVVGANKIAFVSCGNEQDLATLSKKHLKNINRFMRKAGENHGKVWLELKSEGSGEEIFEDFLRVEDASWKGSKGAKTSIACSGSQGISFYRQLYRQFGKTNDSNIMFLRFGDVRVATAFSLRTGSCWYLYKIGYDEAYAALAPGNILLKLLVERMAGDPDVTEINLVTCPEWSDRWHMASEATKNVLIYSNSVVAQTIRILRAMRRKRGTMVPHAVDRR
ncbi:MAG: GNAT family N-acetyltransferase [Cellvibrionaceae bacterium]